jgi:hypothetical protein
MSDLVTPAPPSLRPEATRAGSWAVRLAIALFVASLVLPAFWLEILWDGGWRWGWEVMLLGLTGFLDSFGFLVFALFPLAALAYLGSSYCFLVRRFRASVALAILSLLLVIGITALLVVSEVSEGIGQGRQHSWIVGPGQVLWFACPAINLWQAWRAWRGPAAGLLGAAGVAEKRNG